MGTISLDAESQFVIADSAADFGLCMCWIRLTSRSSVRIWLDVLREDKAARQSSVVDDLRASVVLWGQQ
jgi:hypothetical protein